MGLTRTDLMGIVSHVLDLSNERLLMEPARKLDEPEWDRIRDLIGERLEGKPLAYLTHRKEFFSETFYVDERVLIPRPETELLVEEALSIIGRSGGAARVLDMGTGSGIIGILLAKKGAQRVLSVDVSAGALEVAQLNARALSVAGRIDFAASDLFSSVKKDAIFDLVCANLPYVGLVEWDGLMADVRCYEPKEALLGGTRGFELYSRFIPEVSAYLHPGGCVLCEIGGEAQARVVGDLLKDAGFEVMVKHDLAGRQRVVSGTWTSSS
jgi:release factor glutamine methyltransferase